MLTILIPTIPARRGYLTRLMNRLGPQLPKDFKIEILETKSIQDGGPTIGEKRNTLLERVRTPYSCFVDDDDQLANNYCKAIRQRLIQGPDVVGFRLRHFVNGDLTGLSTISLECKTYRMELNSDGLYRYHRTPNHLSPIRIEMAREIGFPDKNMGEDADYARKLYGAFALNMKEEFIDEYLYDYLYRTEKAKAKSVEVFDKDGYLTRSGMEQAIRQGGSVYVNGYNVSTMEELDHALPR